MARSQTLIGLLGLDGFGCLTQNVRETFVLLESLVLSLSASPTYCWHPSFSFSPSFQTCYSDPGMDIGLQGKVKLE